MCYLSLWNEFGEIVMENIPIYTLEVHSEVRVTYRNRKTYLTLETLKSKVIFSIKSFDMASSAQ